MTICESSALGETNVGLILTPQLLRALKHAFPQGVGCMTKKFSDLREGNLFVWATEALEMSIPTMPHRPQRIGRAGRTVDRLLIVDRNKTSYALCVDSVGNLKLDSTRVPLLYPHDPTPVVHIDGKIILNPFFQESYERILRHLP
jgi:hypothetical protein